MEYRGCKHCQVEKPLDEFAQVHGKKCRYRTCKKCRYSRDFYNESRKGYLRRWQEKRRYENVSCMLAYFQDHPCVDCGESNPILLEFDYVVGDKVDTVSNLIHKFAPLDKIKQEVEKCEVRCVSCHRKRTAKTYNWYKYIH